MQQTQFTIKGISGRENMKFITNIYAGFIGHSQQNIWSWSEYESARSFEVRQSTKVAIEYKARLSFHKKTTMHRWYRAGIIELQLRP